MCLVSDRRFMRNFAFIAVLCIAFCCAHGASAQTSQVFPPKGTVPCSASNPLFAWNGTGDTYCTGFPTFPTCTPGQLLTSDGTSFSCVDPSPTCPSGQSADSNGTCCAASSIVNGICGGGGGCPSGQSADSNGTCCKASSMVNGICGGGGTGGVGCSAAELVWTSATMSCLNWSGADGSLGQTITVSAQGLNAAGVPAIGSCTFTCEVATGWWATGPCTCQ